MERTPSGYLRQIAPYVPTEDEIAAATAKIREGWNDDDYAKRAAWAQPVEVKFDAARPASRRNDQFVITGD